MSERKRKTVLLDCDGVLADFIGGVCRTLAELGHPGHEPEHVTEFDFCKALKLDDETRRKIRKHISGEPGWWMNLAPFQAARLGVAELREVADVYVVTSPWNSHPNWLHERESWLKRHFGIPHSHVIACSAKHLVRGDVFVDDKTEAVQAWGRAHPNGIAVQWETPHNCNDGHRGDSTRSWSRVLEWALGADHESPRPLTIVEAYYTNSKVVEAVREGQAHARHERLERLLNDRRGFHVSELDEETRAELLDAITAAVLG